MTAKMKLAGEWEVVMKLAGECEGVTTENEIVRPKIRPVDTWEGSAQMWHCTVEREDAKYRRRESFDVNSFVSLAEVSYWIGSQVTYASGLKPREETPE